MKKFYFVAMIIGAAAPLLGLIVFWREARALGVRGFWAVVLGTLLIGFSFGLPLYLYLRESRFEAEKRHSYRAATP